MAKGIDYLRAKLNRKRERINLRYSFYEMKHMVHDLGIAIPKELRWMSGTLGWCAKGVDALADRIVFRGFRNDNYNLNEIFQLNNQDILSDSATLSALITSCCFIYISADDAGFPRLQVIDGGNATGEIDPITYLLTEGYAVLKRDNHMVPEIEAYFEPGRTTIYEYGKEVEVYDSNVDYPLLVPIIYRPDDRRPFGHSRISRDAMSLQDAAVRTLRRLEVTAEFYSFPQKYVTGLSQDAERMDHWKATISTMLAFEKDDAGEYPRVGQFTQQSAQPHIDELKTYASVFAGQMGLTLDDLGFPSDVPSSAEAIKAAHENLRLTARKAQRTFGVGLLNAGFLAASLRDNYDYARSSMYETSAMWEPIFEPDAAGISGIGDAILKLNQAIPGYVTEEKMREMIGF